MAERNPNEGKLMGHGCGSPFRVCVITRLDDFIVIAYRDAHRLSLPPYHCPRCEHRLELWWRLPACQQAVLDGGDSDE